MSNTTTDMEQPLHLFDAYGIELEYMIVDNDSLSVRPVADAMLRAAAGEDVLEVERGDVGWSNELALHVIEMKTNGPRASLEGLGNAFQSQITDMEALLKPLGARLMPTAMHPWMNPDTEFRLWPHENDVIYSTFDRIFDCRGHGWSNLQSMHINLPFADDEEFAQLHAAVRLVLPLIPALAASSPYIEGQRSGLLDTRVDVYRTNARRVPSVSGVVVPERVYSRAAYEGELLQRIYDDLAPHDPEGVLREEWVNARGCIARFDRMAVEIRVTDVQECPMADVAIAMAVAGVVRALVEEEWCDHASQRAWDEHVLSELLVQTTRDADAAVIRDEAYLKALGYPEAKSGSATARDVWSHLIATTMPKDAPAEVVQHLSLIQSEGCLARRIVAAVEAQPAGHDGLHEVYRQLCDCLRNGVAFALR